MTVDCRLGLPVVAPISRTTHLLHRYPVLPKVQVRPAVVQIPEVLELASDGLVGQQASPRPPQARHL